MIQKTLTDIIHHKNNYQYKNYFFNNAFIFIVNSKDEWDKNNYYTKIKDVEGLNRKQIIAEIDALTRKDNFLKDFNKIINE